MQKNVKNGLRDCTVILDGSECEVRFDTCFRAFSVRNDGASDVFISKTSGIVPDDDGVMCVKAGASAVFAHMDIYADTVYLLGNGKVQVHGQQDSINPFNYAPTFDGGVQAEGNPVVMDNLQGGVPFSEMVVSGKNLLKYPYNETQKTQNGITFTPQSDGGIAITGQLDSGKSASFAIKINFRINGAVCMSGGSKNIRLQLNTVDNRNFWDIGNGAVVSDVDVNYVRIFVIEETELIDTVIYPQIETGTTATAYEPPITGRDLTVNVSGKNLISISNWVESQSKNGIDVTVSNYITTAEGTLTGNMVIPSSIARHNCIYQPHIGDVYILSVFILGGYITNAASNTSIAYLTTFDSPESGRLLTNNHQISAGALTTILSGFSASLQIEITADMIAADGNVYYNINHYGRTGNIYNNVQIAFMLTKGMYVLTEYEPYHGAEYTITPDVSPYIIPNDIRQVDGLNNISVSEGELSVSGVRKNAAFKRIWDEIDEIKTAIIVSNGESE